MKTLIFAGYFLAQCVDKDSDGKYNILFEFLNSARGKAHPMIAHWEDSLKFERGKIYNLQVKAECTPTFEVVEGNGKSGSGWAPEDDWIYNGKSLICNAIKVDIISSETLTPCEQYSRYCNICD